MNGSITKFIDQTLLKPDATREEIEAFCREASKYEFAAVCINPYWVSLAVDIVRKSGILVSSVVGFPLGATTMKAKVAEAISCVEKGALEIEMVMNIGALKSGETNRVLEEIGEVVDSVRPEAIVKVILEAHLLSKEEKEKACLIAREGGAHFVKTSTGFSSPPASVEEIVFLRRIVGEGMGVKAAGGIRSYAHALALIRAGANRIGTSAGIKILNEEKEKFKV